MSALLITGSTGNFGTAAINHIVEQGTDHHLIGLARDPDKGETLEKLRVEIRTGDYNDKPSLEKAFQEVDKVLFVSGSDLDNRSQQHKNVVDALKTAGVKHVIYTSFQRESDVEESPIPAVAESHLNTENWIKESGLDYTLLRNNLYMDFVPMFIGDQVLERNTVYIPAGEGKMACAMRKDMAEASANVLIGEGHENKTYRFANTNSYSFQDVADYLSEISGKEITYVSPDPQEYSRTMKEAGVPEEAIGMTVGFSTAVKQGEFAETTSDLKKILGREPLQLKDFLKSAYR